MKKVLLYFLAVIILQVAVSLLGGIAIKAMGLELSAGLSVITLSIVSNVIIIATFIGAGWCKVSRWCLDKSNWRVMALAAVMALGILIPSQCLEELIPEEMRTDLMGDIFKQVMGSVIGYIGVGLMAPLMEEMVFRGAIMRTLVNHYKNKNMSVWWGIGLSALLFAVIHGNPAQMPHAFLLGLLMGWLCYHTGSIVPGIIVHWVNNSVSFLMCSAMPETYDMSISELFGGNSIYIAVAIIASLALFIPSLLAIAKTSGQE